jgi:hypothetical protein
MSDFALQTSFHDATRENTPNSIGYINRVAHGIPDGRKDWQECDNRAIDMPFQATN